MRTLYASTAIAALLALPWIFLIAELGPPRTGEAWGRITGSVLGPFLLGAVVALILRFVLPRPEPRAAFVRRMNWTALILALGTLLRALLSVAGGGPT